MSQKKRGSVMQFNRPLTINLKNYTMKQILYKDSKIKQTTK